MLPTYIPSAAQKVPESEMLFMTLEVLDFFEFI